MSVLDKIVWKPLKKGQYKREAVDKKTIFLHHTAGNANPFGVLKWWNETPQPIATAFVIGGRPTSARHNWKDGELVQCFSSKYWAWHLGLKQSNMPPGSESSKILNSQAIAIEICNWGYLTERDGKFYSYANVEIPQHEVVTLRDKYRGYRYWHMYTPAQLATVKELLQYLTAEWNIPTCYKGDQMFELDMRAFEGEPGIWTHTSVRADKTDCYPSPQLIKMLKEVGGTQD